MANFNDFRTLHKQAASYHEAAAFLHHMASQHHAANNLGEAKSYAKTAMECANAAQKNSTSAWNWSAK